jgi:hypothetical protein
MFAVLADNEYSEYEGFEDTIPYNIVEGKWKWLYPSPIGRIINDRFSTYYDGKLTWREINAIKEKMDRCAENRINYEREIEADRYKLIEARKEQKKLCNAECAKKLEEHLKICDATKYKCTEKYVAYDCRFKENGRCSHHYEIEHINKELEKYEYYLDEYEESYIDYEVEYERALAIKENRYEEYKQRISEYFD